MKGLSDRENIVRVRMRMRTHSHFIGVNETGKNGHYAAAGANLHVYDDELRRCEEMRAVIKTACDFLMTLLHDKKNRAWPPPPAHGDAAVSDLARLHAYFRELECLGDRVQVCHNCRQKDANIGVGDGDGDEISHCWYCREKSDVLNWRNGLDLDINEDHAGEPPGSIRREVEGVHTITSAAARAQFEILRGKHGELSPTEEDLISRIRVVDPEIHSNNYLSRR